MEAMRDRRRDLLAIITQVFVRCGELERFIRGVGLEPTTACPKEVDEKKSLAVEFERAAGWLCAQVCLILNELRAVKRRVLEVKNKLERTEDAANEANDQATKLKNTVDALMQKLEGLEEELNKVA